jgi:ribonuclease H / adenosylcobalamin/alpha-ribazole phosphatase
VTAAQRPGAAADPHGSRSLIVEADGGSRGNPGRAGYGALVADAETGEVLAEVGEAIGHATNNVAEYRGLIAGLREAARVAPGAAVEARMDSKLVVEQMSGRWQIKHPDLRPLARAAREAASALRRVSYVWVPRERNRRADKLANDAMDGSERLPRDATQRPSGAPTGQPSGAAGETGLPSGAAGEPARPDASAQLTFGEPEPPASDQVAALPGPDRPGPDRPAPDRPPDRPGADRAGAERAGEGRVTVGRAARWGTHSTRSEPPVSTVLLRHGQTPLSAERRFAGSGDIDLTELGARQAKAAAQRLARRGDDAAIGAIVTSPLLRARRTAAEAARATGAPLRVEADFRETDFGAWEGLTFAEAEQKWPAEMAAWLADPGTAPPGGESFTEVDRRVMAALDRLLARYAGATVLVVSHVTPIKTLVRRALLAPIEALYRMHLDVASLCEVDWYSDGPAVVRSLNDTTHLTA